MELKQAFLTPDGKVFETRAEAQNYLRRPKIKDALLKLTDGNKELSDWLLDNQESVEIAFEQGVIRRVSKSDRNKLVKALEHIKEDGNSKFQFVIDHADAIAETFRWPTVKRMDEDEKKEAARKVLVEASDGNKQLADWILANKDAVIEAYKAGIEKKAVNPKAMEALAAYRAKKAAEKAAKEAKKTA